MNRFQPARSETKLQYMSDLLFRVKAGN